MIPQIYLIRHGETAWSLTGQHTGSTDIPLTSKGEEEAKKLGQQIRGVLFDRVLTSPLLRARRTCELATAALNPAPEIDSDLAEWDYGDYEGLQSPEILAQRPDWSLFHDGSPNGENPVQVSLRADRLIARLREFTGNVAVFTHGHFGPALTARWLGLPLSVGAHFQLGTASVSILSCDPHHPKIPVIALWNALALRSRETGNVRAMERWENEGGEVLP